jgi:signal transduction histidine kinase
MPLAPNAPAQPHTVQPELWRRLWDRWTEPSSAIIRPEERRRARLLSSLLLILIPTSLIMSLVVTQITLGSFDPTKDPVLVTSITVLSLAVPVYFLSRTRHMMAAANLSVLLAVVATWTVFLLSPGRPHEFTSPYFLGVSVLLSSILLPLRTTITLAVGNMLALAAVPYMSSRFDAFVLAGPFNFLLFLSAFIITVAVVRHKDLVQIETQARTLEESEQRLRRLFDSTFEGVVVHDGDRIIEANAAAEALLKAAPQGLGGGTLSSFLGERILEPAETSWQTTLLLDGQETTLEVASKPYIQAGRPLTLTALRDVTARRLAERANLLAQEQRVEIERLKAVDQFKTNFINTAAHEFGTPLTPIRLQMHVLKSMPDAGLSTGQKRSLEIMDRNVDRLTSLVSDVLEVARLQTGRLALQKQPFDLAVLLRESLDAFQEPARMEGQTLELQSPSQLEVYGDPARLTQVLFNLVNNALKFTPRGGRIQISAKAQGDFARVQVTDTGVGLTPEQHEKLFRPFSQAHDSRHITRSGTGLGLYICKGFVEEHGGAMGVESPGPNQGSTFHFTIPRRPPEPVTS